MKLLLNKAHYPVTVLGAGNRIGLWLQGCSLACKGCMSQDTWPRDLSKAIEVDLVIEWCRSVAPSGPDGVTISGGEPFEQPEALAVLLDGLLAWRAELPTPFDILCYSGFRLKWLQNRHPGLLGRLDVIIPEPFEAGLPKTDAWRGSSNQPLVPLTELGEAKYRSFLTGDAIAAGGLQVTVENNRIWYIGVPERGTMDRLDEALRSDGIEQGDKSWE